MTGSERKAQADDERIIPWAEGSEAWNAIAGIVSDLYAVDLVTFLVQNPFACDTADNLAVYIGRKTTQVQPILDALADAGFVQVTEFGPLRVYELTSDPSRRQTLQQYVTWLREGYHWARLAIDQP